MLLLMGALDTVGTAQNEAPQIPALKDSTITIGRFG